jgi:glutathione peroxidase
MADIYGHEARLIDGRTVSLSDWRGMVLLIVNTASHCGLTPQYAGLEALQERFGSRGFSVLGFPCNQFGHQEPGSNAEIAAFCSATYQVSFPMFAKIDVNGPGADPLFRQLKADAPGFLGTRRIKWNFTKFLVDRSGQPVARFAPLVKPEDIASKIERLL